jgi:hypothetical protein
MSREPSVRINKSNQAHNQESAISVAPMSRTTRIPDRTTLGLHRLCSYDTISKTPSSSRASSAVSSEVCDVESLESNDRVPECFSSVCPLVEEYHRIKTKEVNDQEYQMPFGKRKYSVNHFTRN